jgi:hypothetical protein
MALERGEIYFFKTYVFVLTFVLVRITGYAESEKAKPPVRAARKAKGLSQPP